MFRAKFRFADSSACALMSRSVTMSRRRGPHKTEKPPEKLNAFKTAGRAPAFPPRAGFRAGQERSRFLSAHDIRLKAHAVLGKNNRSAGLRPGMF